MILLERLWKFYNTIVHLDWHSPRGLHRLGSCGCSLHSLLVCSHLVWRCNWIFHFHLEQALGTYDREDSDWLRITESLGKCRV